MSVVRICGFCPMLYAEKSKFYIDAGIQNPPPTLAPFFAPVSGQCLAHCGLSSVQRHRKHAEKSGVMVLFILAWQVSKHPTSFSAPRAPKALVSLSAGDFIRDPAVQAAYSNMMEILGNLQKVLDFVNSFNNSRSTRFGPG